MSSYSTAQLAAAIRNLERTVQTLSNKQQYPYQSTDGDDSLGFLQKQFEKLNSMLGLLHTSAQMLAENGISFTAWKQTSNVWKNILEPLSQTFFIDKKLENGLTRTVTKVTPDGRKYALQGANTLCADVYELVVIHRNGLAKNVIPNDKLPDLWNELCTILATSVYLGESTITQSYTTEMNVNGVSTYIQSGSIGGFKRYESVLEQYCVTMWKIAQSILNRIDDIRIGGVGTQFGVGGIIAVPQVSIGSGVSLAPYNTCSEIFNVMGSPLTVCNSGTNYPFESKYNGLRDRESTFQWSTTQALLSMYTIWNPYVEDYKTLIGGQNLNEGGLTPLQTEENTVDKFGYTFGATKPHINRFDPTFSTLSYATDSTSFQLANSSGICANLRFNSEKGVNGTKYNPEDSSTECFGTISGKIAIEGVGFNFNGVYSNVVKEGEGKNWTNTQTGNVNMLAGKLYYA